MGPLALQRLIGNRSTMAALGITSRVGGGVVQRKGVKSELEEADATFEEFQAETEEINELRWDIGNDLYNAYKPVDAAPTQPYWDKEGRRSKTTEGNLGDVDEEQARSRAQGLNVWAETAASSARRIFNELKGAQQQATAQGAKRHEIQMGMSTKLHPDSMVASTAIESKYVTSPAQGAVDLHVEKATSQLDAREHNDTRKVDFTKWVVHLAIDNEVNPWPFTPRQLEKIVANKKLDKNLLMAVLTQRVEESRFTDKPITVRVWCSNPDLKRYQPFELHLKKR